MRLDIALFTVNLFISFVIIIFCSLELRIHRKYKDLTLNALLEGKHEIDFKLTFNENRPMIRESIRFLPLWCCKSFNTKFFTHYKGEYCHSGKVAHKVFEGSLRFDEGFSLENIQFLATQDESTSQRTRYSGILGLNSINWCDEHSLDPNAPLNQLRKNEDGFTIDIPRLIFTSDFDFQFQTPFNGNSFEIVNFRLGSVDFRKNLQVKIDLDTNEIKLPVEIYFEFKRNSNDFRMDLHFFTQSSVNFGYTWEVSECSFELPSGAKMYLPVGESGKISVDFEFIPHDEEWISLGLVFLDYFAVSFDMIKERIYFNPKSKFIENT
jgi:hypothetical protein